MKTRIQPEEITKRIVTSEAARIFDPQGFVTPITVRAKFFIQELWRSKDNGKQLYGWDDPLPPDFVSQWREFCDEVGAIEQIRIPRWLGTTVATKNQIHMFCDASQKAYGVAAYVQMFDGTSWSARLLCSKSRVAPIRSQTIPILELSAVALTSNLIPRIRGIEQFNHAPIYVWTDSEIVLYWLRKPPHELKTFVANRVATILRRIDAEQTRHVSSQHNPADLLSRGTKTSTLVQNSLWWNGPPMLTQPKLSDAEALDIAGSELKKTSISADNVLLTTISIDGEECNLMGRWASHRKVCRVTAIVFRFCLSDIQTVVSETHTGIEMASGI